MLAGQPIKVTGVIVYNFNGDQPSVEASVTEVKEQPRIPDVVEPALTPEMQAERERLEKERRAEEERLRKERQAEEERLEKERLAAEARRAEEAKYRLMLAEKLHFRVFAVVERLRKNEPAPVVNESLFVRDGKASIDIHLTGNALEALEKLKNAGLEIASEDKNRIAGQIPIEKLVQLAELAEVRYIFPSFK
jgi:hypothetical protein